MRSIYASTTKEGEIPMILEFERWGLSAFEKEDFPTAQKQLVCSGTTPQWCKFGSSGPTSTEQLENLAVYKGRWRQCATIDTASRGSEWLCSFFQAIGSTSAYCYRYTNADFGNSSTFTAPWTACKSAFIQDPSHGKSSTDASAMGSWAQSLESWLAPSCLSRWITLHFVGPWWLHSR